MRIALPPFLSLMLLSLACLGLGGCGQKGPLFIPSDDSPPHSQAPLQSFPAPQPAQQPTP